MTVDHLTTVLDDDERRVMAGYRHRLDRQSYLVAHVAVRLLLGDRLGIAPSEVRLGRDPCPLCGGDHGRPTSLDDPGGTSFGLSRTRGMVVVALADRAVGVDVESVSTAEWGFEMDAMLHLDERAAVQARPPEDRARARLSCWVRTEAYLKGRGCGLGISPASIAVGPAAQFSSTENRVVPITTVAGWSVVDLDLGPGHVGALALNGPIDEIVGSGGPVDHNSIHEVRVHHLSID